MKLNKAWLLGFTFIACVLIVGCSSTDEGNANTGDNSANEKQSEMEKVFEETDKIALEFYKAGFELNIPKVYEMLSPNGKDTIGEFVMGMEGNELDVPADQLVEDENFKNYKKQNPDKFKEFEKLNDEYELRRYDNVYDEEKKEIIYRVEPWYEYETFDNSNDYNYISLKQNNDGEWVVKTFLETIIPDRISDKNSGTIIHPYKESEEPIEDEYGFDD
ncbi:hypothetical protein [Oceanobacillus damuensis]|uniref:hypothetical protein n=1 Tax=Oceanobacillus damuensis TaxID=937928 RepID=UPI00082DDFD0|nr:hypothetical protein [Oceanobacillus damuensis]